MHVADLAGATNLLWKLGEGYETELGEHGATISGGQRQRIAIARALLTSPKILIFDEATSALDYESEHMIRRNMGEIAQGRTVFIISHRLSAVRDCDCIYVMENGEIVETGTHKELAVIVGGRYARLLACSGANMDKDSLGGVITPIRADFFPKLGGARHEMQGLPHTREEAQFLPPILEVLETPPPLLARMILWVVMLFFVVAVIWAIIGRTDIVATASGKIIPDDRIKVVQAAEAGTIQEIRVRDGDTVKRDDVLILLDTTVTDAEYAQAEEGLAKSGC